MRDNDVRVLYIVTKLELGGAQKVCLSLLKGLRDLGCYSGLISGDEGVLVNKVASDSDVYLVKEFKREVGVSFLISEFKAFFLIFKHIKNLKKKYPNLIVHTHSTKAGFFGRWAAFFADAKTRIHTVHGFGFHEYQPRIIWLVQFFLEWVTSLITTHYVCVSRKDQELGKKKLPFFSKKSSIIRAAVEWDNFYIPAKKETTTKIHSTESCIIGTVSCFKPQKNLGDLLQAFKWIIENNPVLNDKVFLHIIGDGIMRRQLQSWVNENSLSENVLFLGWQHDVAQWIKSWDVFAMSSLWEGLPCAVVEARLSKLPVIAYGVGGVDEVVVDGRNGFVIAVGNWKMFAEKLLLLIKDASLRKSMSNFEDDLEAFHDKEMIRQHFVLYKQIVALQNKS